jgi:hypothetical protein
MEIKPSEGIAQILELIGSVTVAAPADYTKNIHIMKQQPSIYMGKVGEAVKHAATWVKITKTDLQATGCTGGSSVLHPSINAYPSAPLATTSEPVAASLGATENAGELLRRTDQEVQSADNSRGSPADHASAQGTTLVRNNLSAPDPNADCTARESNKGPRGTLSRAGAPDAT